MRYNAGSEIYTQNIARGLQKNGHKVMVFSRFENPFLEPFQLIEETDKYDGIEVPVTLINVANLQNRYQTNMIDKRFKDVIKKFTPDLVHFNHLNHLSLGLVDVCTEEELPIVFTLHDFWLSCPRGQFIQNNYGLDSPWKLCDGQEDQKCAEHCFMRFATGEPDYQDKDTIYWTQWVRRRREHIAKIVQSVDKFLSPSFYLMKRMKDALGIPDNKIEYLDYGFDLKRLSNRQRMNQFKKDKIDRIQSPTEETKQQEISNMKFTFGYIGTHIVTKGIHILIEAFSKLKTPAKLIIWGRERSETTPFLKRMAEQVPEYLEIEWRGEYENQNIVKEVFNYIDAIVVPSIWMENSPLVIHEAQQVRVPVITANAGGMADYVRHMENGLLFKHRNIDSLREQLEFAANNPDKMRELGQRGYLYSDGDVVSIEDHVTSLEQIYNKIIGGRGIEK